MNPYRNNLDLKSSFKKRSILKTLNWKIRIKIKRLFKRKVIKDMNHHPKDWGLIVMEVFVALTMLALLAIGLFVILDAFGFPTPGHEQREKEKQEQRQEKIQEEQRVLKEKKDKIQREIDLIKAIEENNRLLKEMKNK